MSLMVIPSLARAGDDVCTIRPDLCGGKVKKKRSARGAGKRKCRNPRDHRDSSAHLPVCSEAAMAAHAIYQRELADDPRFGSKEAREGIPDDSFAMKPRRTELDIDHYVNQNAADPALARHQNSQQAFVERRPEVTYGFTSGGGSAVPFKDAPEPGGEEKKETAPPSSETDREPASAGTNR